MGLVGCVFGAVGSSVSWIGEVGLFCDCHERVRGKQPYEVQTTDVCYPLEMIVSQTRVLACIC